MSRVDTVGSASADGAEILPGPVLGLHKSQMLGIILADRLPERFLQQNDIDRAEIFDAQAGRQKVAGGIEDLPDPDVALRNRQRIKYRSRGV